jgi:hypothetical protein
MKFLLESQFELKLILVYLKSNLLHSITSMHGGSPISPSGRRLVGRESTPDDLPGTPCCCSKHANSTTRKNGEEEEDPWKDIAHYGQEE